MHSANPMERCMMNMAVQRQGYYENGNYFFSNMPTIPSGKIKVTVIFHDIEDDRAERVSAIKNILAEAAKAEDELSDNDWSEIANSRTHTNAGLMRAMKI